MPTASVNGVAIYYEDTGRGFPLVWSHEFGGDHRSWEPQVRYFSRRYRVITPTLVMTGDQDEPCIEPSLFMRRHIPNAGLAVVPMTGHTVNIEEPLLFNQAVGEFLTAVESGRWGTWTA